MRLTSTDTYNYRLHAYNKAFIHKYSIPTYKRYVHVHTYTIIHIHTLTNTTRGQILRSEFVQEPVMRSLNTEYGWAAIMCATGPSLLTASVREHCLLNNIDNQVCIPVWTYVCTNACKRCLTHIELYVTTSLCMAM